MSEASVRWWQWRPASRASVIGWWVASLVTASALAVIVAVVAGGIAWTTADPGVDYSGLGAIVWALAAFAIAGYVGLLTAALVLASRYVPPERRTPGWRAVFGGVLALGAALAVVGLVTVEQLVVATAAPALAVAVPALVASRVPLLPAAARVSRTGGPEVSDDPS
ncbi:hypothetical protein Q6348_02245 [Isoptericola sp. b441]|uniref:Uncharacterized protein n=1 Tax=Actinotalea lenta TaxID=3064654 RepID=A0ABT9D5F4_9CELL|nr:MULTISPECIES: hypothetical protein [unclassified Isoptericola]MDO8106012.1 hypothetical protein [Isoptericola sp. b441]MDO8122269.1 hypothetical protein [Isoptericola sp. b490]